MGCAEALVTLHDCQPGLSHNDIKSQNFLVHLPELDGEKATEAAQRGFLIDYGGRFMVKIADVEFAGVNCRRPVTEGMTPNWTAPEVSMEVLEAPMHKEAKAEKCRAFQGRTGLGRVELGE